MQPTPLLLALLLATPTFASAQSGAFSLRLGAMQIRPDVTSGDLSGPVPGVKADVEPASQASGGITWHVNERWSLDLPLAAPFRHDIVGDGAIASVGKIAEVRALPATLLLQFGFAQPGAALRPYAGIGPTYAVFSKARGNATLDALTGGTAASPTTLKVDEAWGFTVQGGVAVALAPRWSLDLSVMKTALKTRATLSTGQTQDLRLDPWVAAAGIAYRF